MESSLDHDIRERLARYLRGETRLRDFDAWFVPATWEVDQERDPVAYDLTNEIYLRLAEYSNGQWTEAELKDRLRHFVESHAIAP